ncbi:hypothetical protein [Halohasta salina]|uniref:hypothetical protein n=1 Tax=Halohasta salina TaxID=2961621 RepID=UPI0020A3D7F1|nr:hypothetical protein [Halohasta salina]
MKQAGVWSFRTATGVARVVDGSLRRRTTLRGLTVGNYTRRNWHALFRALGVGVSAISLLGPVREVTNAVIGSGGALSTIDVISVAALFSVLGALCLPFMSRPSTVDIYDMTDVSVDADDHELTIQYADDGGDPETTTVDVADEAALGEAVAVLSLKGAPVEEAVVEKWG